MITIERIGHSSTRSLAGALAAVAVAASPAAFGQSPIVEAFASLPSMQSPSMSADGARIAFISHATTASYVIVTKLDGMETESGVDMGDIRPQTVAWASDDALVLAAGTPTNLFPMPGQAPQTSPYGVDLNGGKPKVTRLVQNRGARGGGRGGFGGAFGGSPLLGYDRGDGRALYTSFDADTRDRVLYAIDPKDDDQRTIDRGSRTTRDWVVDESGNPVYRLDTVQGSNMFHLLGRGRNAWEVIVEGAAGIPQLTVYGLDADGDIIVGARPADTGRFGLYKLSAETAKLGEPVVTNDRYDVTSVRTDPYTNRVLGGVIADVGTVWIDAELAEQQKLLDDAFPGESPAMVSWSADRGRFIVVTNSTNRAPGIYLYDARAPSLDQIAAVYEALKGARLPDREPYSFEARDGTMIPGYLTRPIDAAGATPLVVLPHGGPASRNVGGYDWMAQFLASRGYTVLQVNFRGSGGFGSAWENAGHGEWGTGVMQDDLSDGVAALVDEQLADPQRVCIVGGSYGGYAALAGAVFTPKLYRCAAAFAPVTDLAAMLPAPQAQRGGRGGFGGGFGGGLNPAVTSWRMAMGGGDPASLDDRLRAASPAAHADQAQAPILLIHARDDSVVPIEQSRTMQRALESAGKTVELTELDGDDHWLSDYDTRVATLTALDRFLAENLQN